MCRSIRPLLFSDMKEWSFTTIKHAARKELDISPNEYCVLDYIYQTQTNPKFTRGGWCRTGIHVIAQYFGFSTGTVHKMFARFVERGLLEIDATDAQSKKTTAKFYETAYLDSVQKVNEGVQKVNSTVQKVNTNRSKSEHIIKEDNSKDNRESTPAEFHVQIHSLETMPSVEGEVPRPAGDWMQVAKDMEAYAKGEGAAQWRFMCEAQGYKGEVLPIVSNWASKASKYQLMNWKSEFRKLQTWLKTESRADYKAAQRNGTPAPATSAPIQIRREI